MFNNLIESSSHAKEFKRRGSFLLLTTVTYMVLFAITGVASIYAYDAHLEAQTTELEITFVPLTSTEPEPAPIRNTIRSASNSEAPPGRSVRTELYDSVDNPNNMPPKVSTLAQPVPPARPDSYKGAFNADPPGPVGNNRVGTGGTGSTPVVTLPDDPPPMPEPQKPVVPKVLKISTILNGRALDLPKPVYPQIARQAGVQGTVSVQVLIDEKGRVISAKAITGSPLLIREAQNAALQARFSPTVISEQPVKVSGVITYHFVLNR